PYRTAALASFTSYTLSHNLGLGWLTGGSARLRVYSAAGLRRGEVASVIAVASVTFWIGVFVTAAAVLALHPLAIAVPGVAISLGVQRAAGLTVLGAMAAALLALRTRREISFRQWRMPLPGTGMFLAMCAVAMVDLLAASGALFVLVPAAPLALFPLLFAAYLLAVVIALFSHVPGGVGVFEAVMLAALSTIAQPQLVASLIAFRIVYYLLPLALAALLLLANERQHWHRQLSALGDAGGLIASAAIPRLLAGLAVVGGGVLLLSGSMPALSPRLMALRAIVPLPFVEASHFAASLSGTALLLLAPSLYRRLDGAFHAARMLLVSGALFSLAKGFDYEEAILLLSLAGILQLARPCFYRRSAITVQSLSAAWVAAIAGIVLLSSWLGFMAFKQFDYSNDLWWSFAWHGDPSRFLRASLGAAVLVTAYAVAWWFNPVAHPAMPHTHAPELEATLERALHHAVRSDAHLCFTGDKRFLASDDGSCFLMYQVQGSSWIAMGNPVGPEAGWPELMWRLRELADAACGRVLFYQMCAEALPLAIDMGLQIIKYGEEAHVDLARFSLKGPDARPLRYAVGRAVREGAQFEIVGREHVAELLPELRRVSDEWLAQKGRGEKAFSVGRFDPVYLNRFDHAIVRVEGRIVAFANIWATEGRQELSVDLMRHLPGSPYGTMDFLFASLMAWGREEGFARFNLGLAPLSGIGARQLAPAWAKIGALVYRHGETLYGFEGLRAYKEKYAPLWVSRYIAATPGMALPRALIDLQTLVGGGRSSASGPRRLPTAA
ncbi:MAG: hypothetical protein RLZZ08_2081, partial [Pseudomonadota bacterium]